MSELAPTLADSRAPLGRTAIAEAGPAGAKAEATRAAIVATAEQLFRTLGYQKTTVADIARELRFSPANVYRFFASKTAINEAIAARLLGDLTNRAWEIARSDAPAPERLVALYRMLQQQTTALFFQEKRMHDMVAAALEEHWSIIDAYIQEIDASLAHIVAEGQAEGTFAALDPAETGQLLHATMIAFTHPQVMQECADDKDLAALAEGMAQFALRALRPD
jgi:AcrR family transcriptional regulator